MDILGRLFRKKDGTEQHVEAARTRDPEPTQERGEFESLRYVPPRGDSEVVGPLAAALRDPDASVRDKAALALMKLAHEGGGITALLDAAAEGDPGVRASVVDALIAGLGDRDGRVRLAAASWLPPDLLDEGVNDARAAQALAALLADESGVYAADIGEEALKALVSMGDAATAPLLEMARHEKAFARSRAVTTLWMRAKERGAGDPGAFECFVEALTDESVGVRTQALHGLENLDDPRALGPLEGVLNDESEYIRDHAALVIASMRNEPSQEVAVSQGQDAPELVRLSGTSVGEELSNFQALSHRQQALLDGLDSVPEQRARPVFARAGIDEPNRYTDHMTAFSSFRSAAMTSEGSPIHTRYLTLNESSPRNDFLYVHLGDEVLPVGFLVCALKEGGFLGYYETGSALGTLRNTLQI